MPNKPRRLCTRNGCYGIYDPNTNECNKCGPRPKTNWRPDSERGTRHQRGYDEPWLKLAAYRLIHDQKLCQECDRQGHTTEATEVHHIIPFNGLDDPLRLDFSNLESLCVGCHRKKTAGGRK